jgi:hypothetical protein
MPLPIVLDGRKPCRCGRFSEKNSYPLDKLSPNPRESSLQPLTSPTCTVSPISSLTTWKSVKSSGVSYNWNHVLSFQNIPRRRILIIYLGITLFAPLNAWNRLCYSIRVLSHKFILRADLFQETRSFALLPAYLFPATRAEKKPCIKVWGTHLYEKIVMRKACSALQMPY